MNLDLSDAQIEVLIRELGNIIQTDRYPLSPRIVVLKEILGMMRPEPEREPLSRDVITSRRAKGGMVDDVSGCGFCHNVRQRSE
jgi:hypothetical protein